MNKNKKIFVGILIVLIIVIGVFVVYKITKRNVTNRERVNFTVENISSSAVKTLNNKKDEKNYYKEIDNVRLELDIPSEWKYEEILQNEENDFYKYALKLYKNKETQYAMLYFYNNQFGVCGTGRISKNIILNNGKEATIGYYDENKNWADISFYNINKNIAVINYGLTDEDADEVIEVIKTLNITENNIFKTANLLLHLF